MPTSFQARLSSWIISFDRASAQAGGWVGRLCGLPRLSGWLQRHCAKPLARVLLECLVAVAISSYFGFLTLPQAAAPRLADQDERNALVFSQFSDAPYCAQSVSTPERLAGRGHLPAQLLAGWTDREVFQLRYWLFCHHLAGGEHFVLGGYWFSPRSVAFGLYQGGWLLLCCGLLIFYRSDALLVGLGVFCGLTYNLVLFSGAWCFPWELPGMFFFTWACLLSDRRQFWPLVAILGLGGLFHSTVLLGVLLLLGGKNWPLRKRLAGMAVLVAGFGLCRYLVLSQVGATTLGEDLQRWRTACQAAPGVLAGNAQLLFHWEATHALWLNAGTLLFILVLPAKSHRTFLFKAMALLFALGRLASGSVSQPRFWYELLPLGWMLLSETFQGQQQSQEARSEKKSPLQARTELSPYPAASVLLSCGLALVVGLGGVTAALGWVKPMDQTFPSSSPSPANASMRSHLERGRSFTMQYQFPQALQELRAATKASPQNPSPWTTLAWLLATCPQENLRDHPESIACATRAVELCGRRFPNSVLALALAYGEADQFDKAAELSQEARQRARFIGDQDTFSSAEQACFAYSHKVHFSQVQRSK